MSHFKRFLYPLIGLLLSCQPSHAQRPEPSYGVIQSSDPRSQEWAEYLYHELSTRSQDKSRVRLSSLEDLPEQFLKIRLEIDPWLDHDYCTASSPGQLQLRVREEGPVQWLIYQLVEHIGQGDPNFQVQDLPPAWIDFQGQCSSFDLTYREPHLLPNMDWERSAILGTNHVERDWGLWGHNLGKVLSDHAQVYAQVDGKPNSDQYCFSSPELLQHLQHYILDQYGEGTELSTRFMIAPNDNDLSCTCDRCSGLGNTPGNATPAVGFLLNRLADLFPDHHFFTLAYRSTRTPPTYPWADNLGVFFATDQLPKGVNLEGNPALEKMKKELKPWKEQVGQAYLWDYISNFDDYLTPLPILKGFQQQLKVFHQMDIEGLFLNGSGYDYTSFDDVKTYVLAALMMDASLDVDLLVTRYLEKFYPRSQDLLKKYYLDLEQAFFRSNRTYPMYGGFQQIARSYLDQEKFLDFYEKLSHRVIELEGDEKARIQKLLTALSFTRLQISYHDLPRMQSDSQVLKVRAALEQLQQHQQYPDLMLYREVGGELQDYIEQWQGLLHSSTSKNLLKEGRLSFVSIPDEGYSDPSLLHNGVRGFVTDYHQGWVISSVGIWELKVDLPSLAQARIFEMSFLDLPRHRIYPPQKVELIQDGKLLYSFTPTLGIPYSGAAGIREQVSFEEGGSTLLLRIHAHPNAPRATMASDEIKFLKNP